jgi:hypothetical protein
VKSKLLILTLSFSAAGIAMAQTQASDANANDQTQRNSDANTAVAPADQTQASSQSRSDIQTQNAAAATSNTDMAALSSDDDAVVKNLDQTSFDNRKDALHDVDSRIGKAHRSALKVEVKNVFHKESADVKTEFKAAKEDEKSARTEVKARLKDAENSTADTWEANRTALAQSYQHYCQAVAKVDAFGQNQAQSNQSSSQDVNATSQTTQPAQDTQGNQQNTQNPSSTQPQQ